MPQNAKPIDFCTPSAGCTATFTARAPRTLAQNPRVLHQLTGAPQPTAQKSKPLPQLPRHSPLTTHSSPAILPPMLAKLHTFSLLGIDALPVEAEVDVSPAALPKTVLVGLPEQAVKESIHRIERALVNSGFVLPANRVVINLAPAELPKQAASFDLPLALGLLAASGQISSDLLERYAVVGELALDGSMRPVKGALSMAMAAKEMRSTAGSSSSGPRGLIVPTANAAEAAVVDGIDVIPVDSLTQAAAFLIEQLAIEPTPSRVEQLFEELGTYEDDFADVRGQEMAKRAVMIAAAGNHNLLMV